MARTPARAAATSALALLLVCGMLFLGGARAAGEKLSIETFRSPAFQLGPGDVINKDYRVSMPSDHVALRSFDAQVVDENGTPIPLSETYLHHWVLLRLYVPKGSGGMTKDVKRVLNSGVCGVALPQWFGLGSETRRTNTTIPPPYGIVIGDPLIAPVGYEEAWILNVHAIDTRGAVDVRGCTECVCKLYNVTVDEEGTPIPADFDGGLRCCHDETHCAVRPGFMGSKRMLYMEYTVSWVEISDAVVPVRIYILDVTDNRTAVDDEDSCNVEYNVPKCLAGESECIHTAESFAFLPQGGDVIYAVAHQHSGGIGSTIHNEDGEEICSSIPIYGNGSEVANEDGYIVGMTTCYPDPGSVKVKAGEKLKHTSFYNSEERHTGVMGLWYLLVADSRSPPPKANYHTNMILVAVTVIAAFIFIGVTVSRHMKRRGGSEYEPV